MNTCMKMAKNKAKAEIYKVLAKDMRISTNRMIGILADHGIRRDPEELQRSYLLSVGQQMVSEVRDGEGKREILASRSDGETEYIVIEGCSDHKKLSAIQNRLDAQIAGLTGSTKKVKKRMFSLDIFHSGFRFPRRRR